MCTGMQRMSRASRPDGARLRGALPHVAARGKELLPSPGCGRVHRAPPNPLSVGFPESFVSISQVHCYSAMLFLCPADDSGCMQWRFPEDPDSSALGGSQRDHQQRWQRQQSSRSSIGSIGCCCRGQRGCLLAQWGVSGVHCSCSAKASLLSPSHLRESCSPRARAVAFFGLTLRHLLSAR